MGDSRARLVWFQQRRPINHRSCTTSSHTYHQPERAISGLNVDSIDRSRILGKVEVAKLPGSKTVRSASIPAEMRPFVRMAGTNFSRRCAGPRVILLHTTSQQPLGKGCAHTTHHLCQVGLISYRIAFGRSTQPFSRQYSPRKRQKVPAPRGCA